LTATTTEELVEDIAKATTEIEVYVLTTKAFKWVSARLAAISSCTTYASMAKLVITLPFLGIL